MRGLQYNSVNNLLLFNSSKVESQSYGSRGRALLNKCETQSSSLKYHQRKNKKLKSWKKLGIP
jgi:hypothetical protein